MLRPSNDESAGTTSTGPSEVEKAASPGSWFGGRPFVGRASDLAKLHRELREAIEKGGRVLFLLGEPGMGKTTLIRRYIVQVRDRHWAVQVGYGDAADPRHDAWRQLARSFTMKRRAGGALLRTLPDWLEVIPVVGRVLRAVVETVSALLPRQRPRPGAPVGTATGSPVDAVRTMLAYGPETPRLIILDNMEAADAAELSGAFALIQRVAGTHTLLLIAARTRGGALRPELRDLASETERLGVGRFHRLEGLSVDAVATALEESSRVRLPPGWREWFAETAPIAPGALWERMAALAGEGAVARERFWWWSGRRWTWTGQPQQPPRSAITLPEATPPERALLAAAARLGNEFRVSDLIRELGVPEVELADRLDRLARRGIVAFVETVEIGEDLTDVYRFADRAHAETWRRDRGTGP